MAYQDKPPIDELLHYGMPRRSGRYPWGSGKDPYQHSGDFLSRVDELTKKGMSEKDKAELLEKNMQISNRVKKIKEQPKGKNKKVIEIDHLL